MKQKVGPFQVQMKTLIKVLSDLVDHLDQPDPKALIDKFVFGSRSLEIRYQFGANPKSQGIVWEETFWGKNGPDFRVHYEKEL